MSGMIIIPWSGHSTKKHDPFNVTLVLSSVVGSGSNKPPWQVVGVPDPYCNLSIFFGKPDIILEADDTMKL